MGLNSNSVPHHHHHHFARPAPPWGRQLFWRPTPQCLSSCASMEWPPWQAGSRSAGGPPGSRVPDSDRGPRRSGRRRQRHFATVGAADPSPVRVGTRCTGTLLTRGADPGRHSSGHGGRLRARRAWGGFAALSPLAGPRAAPRAPEAAGKGRGRRRFQARNGSRDCESLRPAPVSSPPDSPGPRR